MTIKIGLLISILSLSVFTSAAQIAKLDKPEFQSKIIDQWWSFENKGDKKDCDMRILIIRTEGFEFNCINWSDGFSGNKCKYDLNLTDNFFEVRMKDCPDRIKSSFLYGYLSESGYLFLLIREKQLPISAAILSEKGWIKFEKIQR